MDQQEKDALDFFNEFTRCEQAQASDTYNTIGESSSSAQAFNSGGASGIVSPTVAATEEVTDEFHITRREGQVTCNLPPNKLLCLAEHRVDFDNLLQNGFDLGEEVRFQGWEKFFTRLNGPVYEALVKEFWKHAEFDHYYVVSHVLGKRIIITEKIIGQLLDLNHREGIRISGRNDKGKFVSTVVNKEIFTDFDPTKPSSEYNPQTLVPKLRIWHRILLTCINPRRLTFSSDHINANQKCIMYHLQNNDKLCLPAILFLHLRESIQKSRTTANEASKIIKYIPFGRLISDILVENGLVRFLRDEARFSVDLKASIGDTLSGKNLKKMKIIDEILVEPTPETDEVVLDRRIMVDDFPPFSKEEPFEAIMEYVRIQMVDGKDKSWFTYDMLPDTLEEMDAGKKRRKKSSNKERMKAAKKQKKEYEKKEEKKKQREIHLKAYTKACNEGNSKDTHSSDSDLNSQDPPSSSTENLSKLSNP